MLKRFPKAIAFLSTFVIISIFLSHFLSESVFQNSNFANSHTWCGDYSLLHQLHAQVPNSSDLWTWDRRRAIIDLAEFTWTKNSEIVELGKSKFSLSPKKIRIPTREIPICGFSKLHQSWLKIL